jgi:type II secretory pathway predicted ATPase ExeA
MYTSFYRLRQSPFSLDPDPDFLYLSETHKKALAVLERSLVERLGVSVIAGETGTGKSTLIQHLLNQRWPNVTFGLVDDSVHSLANLLQRTLLAFGLDSVGKTQSESYDLLNNFVSINCVLKKHQPVLIIDKDIGVDSGVLEELYILSSIGVEENRALRVIFVSSLWETLKRQSAWAQLAGRVGAVHQLEPLSCDETVEYVQHRLVVAGSQSQNLFGVPAYEAVYRYTGGIPLFINILCNAALNHGSIQKKTQISAGLIQELVKNGQVLGPAVDTRSVPFHPTLKRSAEPGRTGQTVTEFIVSDIDRESLEFPNLDAKASIRSEKPQRKDTGAARQGKVSSFSRLAPVMGCVSGLVQSLSRKLSVFNRIIKERTSDE